MTIKALRDLLFASRVDYKEQYRKAVDERKAKLKEATDNFKENSPFLRSRKEQIQKEFDSRIAELRNAEIASIVPAFDALRKAELKRVTEIDTVAMNRINAVANIPMTAEEIKALGGQYNPGTNYWVNRAIASIAEKNGVSPAEIGVEPSLDTKLEILKGLETQFDMMIQSWNPESKTSNAKFDAALGDATLEDAVNRGKAVYLVYEGSETDYAMEKGVTYLVCGAMKNAHTKTFFTDQERFACIRLTLTLNGVRFSYVQ